MTSDEAVGIELGDVSVAEPSDVLARLGVDAARGLESAEAEARLARDGPNTLEPTRRAPRRFARQLADPLVILLLAATGISLAAWLADGAQGIPWEPVVIALIVLGNAGLGAFQERRAEAAVAALQRIAAPTATVIRDGSEEHVVSADVVLGDVLVLREGDAVAADARLIQAASLEVAEAALTGESEPVHKDPATLLAPATVGDRTDMVFQGTAVTRGSGRAVVTATGMDTVVGSIASLLGATTARRTPLQREVSHLGRVLGAAVVVIAAVVVGLVLLGSELDDASDVVQVLLVGVSLAVAAVPEGLPAVLSVVLALGVQRMARRHAIVKRLASVETLGSATVICADKTGTLTRNEMTVVSVVTASGAADVTGTGYGTDGAVLRAGAPLEAGPLAEEVRDVVAAGSLAGDATLELHDGAWRVHGDPTDAAFLVLARKWGSNERASTRVGFVPFTSERRLVSSVERDDAGGATLLVTKGAPEAVITRCAAERVGGDARALDQARRAELLAESARLADGAQRPVAVASRRLRDGEEPIDERLEHDLVLLGIVGMIDPPRPEAVRAVAEARGAGVRVVMLTGDHPRTALRIAETFGIDAGPDDVLSGAELERLGDEELRCAARETSVFARVAPEHKLRIVRALQADGQVVAMTGDGVNDAPALKAADIGVAMGLAGTDVSKEAADMVLTDDDFATIVAAVREGRSILANVQKFLRYLLSSNTGEVLTMVLGVLFAGLLGLDRVADGLAVPLLATQILWINLLTDSGPALAMGVEPTPPDVMLRPPRPVNARVVDAEMQRSIGFIGLVMAIVTLLALDLRLPGGLVEGDSTLTEARTAAFTVLVLAQLFNCLNARSDRESALRRPFVNPLLWLAIGVSAGLGVLVVQVPLLNDAFGTSPLSWGDWLLCIVLASTVLWAEELRKLLRRSRGGVTTPQP